MPEPVDEDMSPIDHRLTAPTTCNYVIRIEMNSSHCSARWITREDQREETDLKTQFRDCSEALRRKEIIRLTKAHKAKLKAVEDLSEAA